LRRLLIVLDVSGVISGYDIRNNPFFIHFQHEQWKPRLLERKTRKLPVRNTKIVWDEETQLNKEVVFTTYRIEVFFEIFRMLPPGKILFFYSMAEKPNVMIDKLQKSLSIHPVILVKSLFTSITFLKESQSWKSD